MAADDNHAQESYSTISQMAREFDVTPRTLRFYEDKGLLSPKRDGQTRLYSNRERGRLKLILQGKSVGLPLDDILEVLELYSLEDGERSQVARAREKLIKQRETLIKQRDDVERALDALQRNLTFLDEQLEKLGPPQPTKTMTAFADHANQTMDKAQRA